MGAGIDVRARPYILEKGGSLFAAGREPEPMPVTPELVIIADDLTGAADSAALLTRRGTTAVVVDPGPEWPEDATVVAVDTDSRHRDPASAAARVAAAAERARDLGAQVVKKIDSTLRGNVTEELRAMTEVLAPEGERVLLVVAPAFPANARTTRRGVVHLAGRPLAAHGSDGDVVGLLDRGGLRARAVAAGPALADRLARAHADGLDAVVVDADTDADLEAVVAAAADVSVPVLLVGSGGLTRPLAGPVRLSYDAPAEPARDGTLLVVGSYAEIARRQRDRLLEHGLEPVVLGDPDVTAARLRSALARGSAVLSPDPEAPVVREQAPAVARRLAEVVAEVLGEVGTLVATGGETARAALMVAGVSRYLVTGEVEPGIVRGRVPELDLDVVTKAGGFGDPDALLRCLPKTSPIRIPSEKGRMS